MVSDRTKYRYDRVQNNFIQWCRFRSIRQPAPIEAVADYLNHVLKDVGPSSTVQRCSALVWWYASQGLTLDTKQLPLSSVLLEARRRIARPRRKR